MNSIQFNFTTDGQPKCLVFLYGPSHHTDLRVLPMRAGANKVCVFKGASTSSDNGFGKIKTPHYGDTANGIDLYADGILLTEPGSAAIYNTADCPTVVLYEATRHRLVICHAGRAALTPTLVGGVVTDIVTEAFAKVTANVTNPRVLAYITGSICPKCFVHDTSAGRRLTQPFLDQFGRLAFKNSECTELDLVTIIRFQLLQLKVALEHSIHDGVCTHETSWLASHRRDGDGRRNAAFAVLC